MVYYGYTMQFLDLKAQGVHAPSLWVKKFFIFNVVFQKDLSK